MSNPELNMNEKDENGFTLLLTYCSKKEEQDLPELVNAIIELGAEVNCSENQGGCTPLQFSVKNQSINYIDILLEHKADPNIADHYGQTPLMEACCLGNVPIATMLLENGADPTLRNKDNKTSIDIARAYNHKEIIRLLRKYKTKKKGKLR